MLTYWRFYWPLALIGVGMVLSVQFQNAALARYPDAVTELAVLALAYGVFSFFNAALQFIAQLANVYARSPTAMERSWRFVVAASTAIMLPLALIAGTPGGQDLVALIFSIDEALTRRVSEYLALLCPLILLNGQRHFFSGLLVQAKLTGWTTVINFIYLGVVVTALVTGLALALKPAYVVVGAETLGVLTMLALLLWARYTLYKAPLEPEHENVSYRELLAFFIPVSTTGVMFALSRPILFAFVARTPDGIASIAALRVAFDFSMIFQQAANQFRHFFISFGFDDLAAKRRFMTVVAAGITAIMLVFALTPLHLWVWGDLMGLPQSVIGIAADATLIMCLMPAIIVYRNYYHGFLMMVRQTGGMAYGSILRVLGIYAFGQLVFSLGILDHISATFILILGFVIEAAIARSTAARATASKKA